MNDEMKKELQRKINTQKNIIANAQGKLGRYQTQLDTEMTRATKPRTKQAQKQGESIPKTGVKQEKKETEKGFFETIFS